MIIKCKHVCTVLCLVCLLALPCLSPVDSYTLIHLAILNRIWQQQKMSERQHVQNVSVSVIRSVHHFSYGIWCFCGCCVNFVWFVHVLCSETSHLTIVQAQTPNEIFQKARAAAKSGPVQDVLWFNSKTDLIQWLCQPISVFSKGCNMWERENWGLWQWNVKSKQLRFDRMLRLKQWR